MVSWLFSRYYLAALAFDRYVDVVAVRGGEAQGDPAACFDVLYGFVGALPFFGGVQAQEQNAGVCLHADPQTTDAA